MRELPQGWLYTTFDDVIESITNGINGKQNKDGIGMPVSRIETIANQSIDMGRIGYLIDYDITNIEKYRLNEGDILFSHINSSTHLGKTALCEKNIDLYHGVNLLRIVVNKAVTPDFFNYYCKYIRGIGDFSLKAQHAVNQSSLNQRNLKQFTLRLAPLNEQIRIADKLDSVLAKVDAAQARMEKIPTLLKRFRQSVLAAATSGELTKEWREQTPIDNLSESELKSLIENEWFSSKQREFIRKNKFPKSLSWRDKVIDPNIEKSEVDTWFSLTLESVAEIVDPNPSHRMPNYVADGVPFISSENITGNDEIDFTVGKKITNDELKKQKERYEIANNSFAFTRIGTIGKSVKLALPHNYGISHAMAVVTPFDNLVNGRFLRLIISCTSILQQASDGVQSVGVPDLGIGKMKNFRIPFPPMAEQKEIVRRVESLFVLADTVEKQYLAAKQRLDRLTQSLLAKAFRGELVAQDPNDEPAAELLKRIQAERHFQPPAKRNRKQPA